MTFNDDRRSVTIEVQDGGFGDSDGVASGVIVDSGGVVVADSTSTTTETSGGGGQVGSAPACFIATAAGEGRGEPGTLPLTAGLLIVGALMGCAMRRRR